MKYKEFLDIWLDLYVKPTVKERTYDRYKDIIYQHIDPHLGNIEMKQLTSRQIQELVSFLLNNRI